MSTSSLADGCSVPRQQEPCRSACGAMWASPPTAQNVRCFGTLYMYHTLQKDAFRRVTPKKGHTPPDTFSYNIIPPSTRKCNPFQVTFTVHTLQIFALWRRIIPVFSSFFCYVYLSASTGHFPRRMDITRKAKRIPCPVVSEPGDCLVGEVFSVGCVGLGRIPGRGVLWDGGPVPYGRVAKKPSSMIEDGS